MTRPPGRPVLLWLLLGVAGLQLAVALGRTRVWTGVAFTLERPPVYVEQGTGGHRYE